MGMSVGVVGLGMFGPIFVEPLKRHPGVQRVALCDKVPERLKAASERFAIAECYDSLEAACTSDLDALVIITQHWMHAPQAIQAMESGKHVYTAVPCAWSLEECDQLVDAVKRTGQIYMNGETSFFRAEAAFCRQKQREGAFGEIFYCEGEYLHDISHGLWEVETQRWGKKFTRDKLGSPPMYYPTHATSFAISVTGAHMVEVSCQGYAYPDDDWFSADHIWGNPYCNEIALFRMSNGAVARMMECRRVGHPGQERCTIYGTEGSFEWGLAGCVWATKHGYERVEPPLLHEPLPDELEGFVTQGHGGAEVYLMNEFVNAVNEGRMPRINVWEAVRYWAPGFVAHESAMRGGELLKVPDWGPPPS